MIHPPLNDNQHDINKLFGGYELVKVKPHPMGDMLWLLSAELSAQTTTWISWRLKSDEFTPAEGQLTVCVKKRLIVYYHLYLHLISIMVFVFKKLIFEIYIVLKVM